jgi:AAA domain-containing protein
MASTAGQQSSRVKTERTTMSMSDFEAEMERLEAGSESTNILIHGDSNVGKTRLAGTCPGRTFWLVCEPGYKSAGRAGAKGMARRISDSATALAAIEWLHARPRGKSEPRYRYLDWIVLDGLSTMQDRFRLAYTAEAFDINPSKRQHRNLPDRPDYFNTQNFLKSWIPMLVDMPCNLIITAHSYRTDDTDGPYSLVYPGIQKIDVANAISGLMDITGYFEAKQQRLKEGGSKLVRTLWFESPPRQSKREDDVRYVCGEKFGVLGSHMNFPTIPKIMEKISA